MLCAAQRRADGSYTCDNCKVSWDADDEHPCPRDKSEYPVDTIKLSDKFMPDAIANVGDRIEPTFEGLDIAGPHSDFTALGFSANAQPSLLEFAAHFYDLQPYQRNLLEMLDRELPKTSKLRGHGAAVGRRT